MTSSELIEQLSARLPMLAHQDLAQSVQAILEEIEVTLAREDRVEIENLAAFGGLPAILIRA